MKYSEFKEEVEKLGFEVFEIWDTVDVRIKNGGRIIAWVHKESTFTFSTATSIFKELPEEEKKELIYIIHLLAKTPPEKREEEKKYRLKTSSPILESSKFSYLNYHTKLRRFSLSTEEETTSYKTIFSESELEHINEKGFIREEVTE